MQVHIVTTVNSRVKAKQNCSPVRIRARRHRVYTTAKVVDVLLVMLLLLLLVMKLVVVLLLRMVVPVLLLMLLEMVVGTKVLVLSSDHAVAVRLEKKKIHIQTFVSWDKALW